MTTLPGRCNLCGAATTISGLLGSDSPGLESTLTFRNVTVSGACPHCGGDVSIVDGAFDVKDEILSIVQAPGWTYDTLRELREELEWALRNLPDDPDAAVERIEEVSPEVGSLIRRTMTHDLYGPTLNLIMALSAVLAAVIAGMAFGQSATQDRTLEQRIEEEEVDRAFQERDLGTDPSGSGPRNLQSEHGADVDRHSDAFDQ